MIYWILLKVQYYCLHMTLRFLEALRLIKIILSSSYTWTVSLNCHWSWYYNLMSVSVMFYITLTDKYIVLSLWYCYSTHRSCQRPWDCNSPRPQEACNQEVWVVWTNPVFCLAWYLNQLYVLIHSSKSQFIPKNIRNSLM